MRECNLVGVHPVVREQEPACAALVDVVLAIAGSELANILT